MARRSYFPIQREGDSPVQFHEAGSFPRIPDSMLPAEPYLYEPRAAYNPEDFGPMPPGREKEYLLPDENNPKPDYLPQDAAGATNYPEGPQYGPEPPVFHATNVPETAQKWGKAGQDYTFLAESPQAIQTAKEIGAPRVMRGYRDEDVSPSRARYGPEPKPEELDEMGKFKVFWGTHVDEKYGGKDPLTVNPSEEGVKAEEAARRKYALELMNREPGTADYKSYEKLISEAKKDAENKAEWQRRIGEEDHKMSQQFFKQKITEQRQIDRDERRQKGLDTLANVDKAQKYTMQAMGGGIAPWNYELPQDILKEAVKDATYPLEGYRLKPMVLKNINRERERAGLPLIVEKELPTQKEYTDWGLFRTGEKTTKKYAYEEGPEPARTKQSGTSGTEAQPGNLPDPQMNRGRSGVETTTGKRYRSNGTRWVEIR